jgi:hypothetical protein
MQDILKQHHFLMIDQHLHDIFNLAQTEDRRTLYLTQTVGRGVFDED